MSAAEVLQTGKVAVITGGADGIGYAAARFFLGRGMRVCIADIDEEKLQQAVDTLGEVMSVTVDVSDMSAVQALKDKVYAQWGQVDLLMNNAGSVFGSASWSKYEEWRKTLDVNLYGIIHGIHCFVPAMLAQNTPGLVINTGSKQGITNPPGDPAYNTSKAAIKAMTEQLQHSFRTTEGCQLSAHLLVPGFTYTGIMKRFLPEKPDGAWLPEQVIDYMADALANGDFYIICPDNEVSREQDNKRMAWAMGDLVENRPPLSRWHPDYQGRVE